MQSRYWDNRFKKAIPVLVFRWR